MTDPKQPINLDANASYGLHPEVAEGLMPYVQALGGTALNPSSIHAGGQRARLWIEEARERVSALIGAPRGARIVFTSGATEANNTALHLALHGADGPRHLVTTTVEHPSVLEPCRALEKRGCRVSFTAPSGWRAIEADDIFSRISPDTKAVSVMLANNESGLVNPLRVIADGARERKPGIVIHSDGVQALGKLPINFDELGVDMLSLSAHKIGGLSGAGALVVSRRIECEPFVLGGPQETRWRAGTENVLGIVSFGLAAHLAARELSSRREKMAARAGEIASTLRRRIPNAAVRFDPGAGLPNTLSVTVPGIRADDLIVACDMQGVLVSSGAACASGKPEPSHVLLAHGLTEDEARATIRLSVTAEVSEKEIERSCEIIVRAIDTMRGGRA